MAENVKGLAMRYKHDGVVYELDSGKLVHTKGEQSIDGKKVFTAVPQVEGAPVEDNDVTNKKYVQDALDAFAAPKVASFTITATNRANAAQGAAPVEINKLKIFLADGRRLDPVFMEEGDLKGSTEAKLLVLTLNKQDQSDLTPTKVAKTEIESYALKDGEFLGKLYPCKFFGQHQDMYSNSGYQDPWNQYWTKADRFWDQESTTSGQVRIDIFDIDQMVQKLTFTSTSSGREAVFTATANDGAKEENGDVQKKENHVFDIVFPKMGEMLSKPGPVLLSTNQVVKDVKTFATPPKSANAPVANDDLANKAYVDNLNNELKGYVDGLIQKPGFDIELQIGVTALTSWNAFSQLNILLDNGKRLEAKYVEDGIKAGSDPAKVVLVMTDNPDAEIPEPELKQASFFDTYELGSNEYACEFYNATAMGLGTIHSDPRQANPWRAYLVNGITSGQKGYYLKLVIKQLQDAISTVQFYCGDKHNGYGYPPKNFIFKASCNGVTTDEQVSKDNPGRKDLIKFDIPADALPLGDNYVDLVSEQTINGVKTFKAPPKSLAEAVDGNDLITKDFATKNFFARENSARDFDILVKMKNDGTWVGFTQFKVLLSNGTRLDIKHLESGSATSATKPLVAVFKTVSDSAAAITAPQRQAKTFFDSYKLEEGEYKGTVSFYKVVGKFNPASSDINPWNVYVGNGNANTYDGIYGLHIEQLDKGLRGVNFKFGDSVSTSWNYTCQQCGIVFTTDLGSLEVEYKGDMSDATEATIELPSDSDILGGFVTVEKDQGISGVKTFKKAPKLTATPAENNDLVNKSYVDASFSPYAPQDWSVQISFGYTSGSFAVPDYTAFSYLKPLLVGGGRLDIKAVSSSISYIATDPINVIWKINPDADAPFTEPQSMTDTNIKSYVLQKGEFRGTIIFAKHYGEATTHSTLYKPWQCYAAKAKSSEQIIFGFTVEGLTVGLKAITFLMGDCRPENNNGGDSSTNKFWAYHTYMKAVSNNVEQVLDFRNNHGYAITQTTKQTLVLDPHKSLPYISFNQAQKELVTIGTEQTVKAVKTFDKFPKVTSASGNLVSTKEELVHRDYIDNNVPPALRTNTIALRVFQPRAITRGQSFSLENIKLVLKNGQCITPFIVDSAGMRDPTNPCPVIWKLVAYSDAVAAPTYKAADEINATKLSAGMYKGSYYPMKRLWNSTGSNASFAFNLFGGAASDGAGNGCDVFKVDIYGLDIPVDRIEFSRGAGCGQIGSLALLISVDGGTEQRCNYTPKDLLSDGQIKESDYVIPVKINNYWKLPLGAGYTTLSSDQTIDGFKSFAKSVSCEVAPTDDAHLVNKKYVDDELAKLVARIAALEAAKPQFLIPQTKIKGGLK